MYAIPNKLAEHVVEPRGARLAALRGVGNAPQRFRGRELPRRDRAGDLARTRSRSGSSWRQAQPRMAASAPRGRRDVGLDSASATAAASASASWRRTTRSRPASPKCRSIAPAARSRSTISGPRSTPASRCSPRNVAAQTEGSIVWALGHVLREQITIKDGRVQQSNFTDYEVMRMSDVPNIEVKVVSTDNPPTGAGEDGAAAGRLPRSATPSLRSPACGCASCRSRRSGCAARWARKASFNNLRGALSCAPLREVAERSNVRTGEAAARQWNLPCRLMATKPT